jgi:diacylglycerol O-acyltransferase / wax synthase
VPDLNPLSPLDSLFLWGERPNTMMHVAGLLQFSPPADVDPTYLREILEAAKADGVVHSPWNRKLRRPAVLWNPLHSWVTDKDVDLDYHVRRDALPSPGSERELGILVSRLHSTQIDFSRPPWELHFIEGLSGGRFAMYMKFHHALIDGYTAMRILARSFSTSPDDHEQPLFFAVPPPSGRGTASSGSGADGQLESDGAADADETGLLADVGSFLDAVKTQASSAVTLGRRVAGPLLRRSSSELTSGLQAPNSILNNRIGQSRRFATQQYSLPELKAIAARHDATLNDVFLAVVGGGLRKFLGEMDQLPERSLVAFLPVNVRPSDDAGGGNAVGAILTIVGSDIEDPVERLEKVSASTRAAKAQLEGMTRQAIMAYGAYLIAPAGLQAAGAITGIRGVLPVNFNLCVSNVPGPRETLYLKGSRLEASYPVSIPFHSMALNITLQSYVDTLGVGFVGCRDTLPHLQRLAVYTGESLGELKAA